MPKIRMQGPITLNFPEDYYRRQARNVFESALMRAQIRVAEAEQALLHQQQLLENAKAVLASAQADMALYCPDSAATALNERMATK